MKPSRAFLITCTIVSAFWLGRMVFESDMWPTWLYVIALPGMDVYRLLFVGRSGYDGWIAATTVIGVSTVFWYLVFVGIRTAVRYVVREWMGTRPLVAPSRTLDATSVVKLVAVTTAFVSLVALQIAGPPFPAPFWFFWMYFVLLPGDMANQLLPMARFSGTAAGVFIALSAGLFWTGCLVAIDTLVRVRKRRGVASRSPSGMSR